MTIPDDVWNMMQQHLGYNDEEMELFRQNPRNTEVLKRGPEIMSKQVVAEVVESHGCNSGHKVGDKLCFQGAAELETAKCPDRICGLALTTIIPLTMTASELLMAGVDPNQMKFNRVACPDVGIRCGGWGKVVFEVKVQDKA